MMVEILRANDPVALERIEEFIHDALCPIGRLHYDPERNRTEIVFGAPRSPSYATHWWEAIFSRR